MVLLSDQKYQKSFKRAFSPPCLGDANQRTACIGSFPPLLKNTHRRLAATSANKVHRPSRYSITIATGSKRLSADSDSLLCHVRLRRTSRLILWCVSGCEHSKIGFILIIPSAYILDTRPPTPSRRRRHTCFAYVSIPFQRACRQCVHESARLPRVLCSHAWYG